MTLEVVIVSFNTASILKGCLESLYDSLKNDKLSSETRVTVVDNGSSDNSVSMLKKLFPQVKIIKNTKNLGFAKANNQAIVKSIADYILLLNSDTLVSKNSLFLLLEHLEKNHNVTVVGPRLLNKDGSLQQSFGFSPSFFKVLAWMLFLDDLPLLNKMIKPYHAQGEFWYNKNREVDWVTGAALMFRRSIIIKAGVFDEKIFMYGEEVEWCYRIRKENGKVVYLHQPAITHFGSGSQKTPGSNLLREFESIKYFYNKYNPRLTIPIRAILKLGALLRLILFGIIRFDSSRLSIYAKALKMA